MQAECKKECDVTNIVKTVDSMADTIAWHQNNSILDTLIVFITFVQVLNIQKCKVSGKVECNQWVKEQEI